MLGVDEAPSKLSDIASTTASRGRQRTVDLAAIGTIDRDDCIERWWQMFGVAPPRYTSLEFMRKALAYETQVQAFGGHSNAVQRAIKASLKVVRREIEANSPTDANVDTNFDASAPTGSALCAELEGLVERPALNADQSIRHDKHTFDACDQTDMTGRDSTKPFGLIKSNGKADSKPDAYTSTKSSRVFKRPIPTKPSVLSIRAGTHLVREWNGRTYQVEALEKGFQLDGKTYRSLSAIAKKITGAHWSGPRFFGLES